MNDTQPYRRKLPISQTVRLGSRTARVSGFVARAICSAFGLFLIQAIWPALAWASSGSADEGPQFRFWAVGLAVVLFVGVALVAKFGRRK